MTQTTTTDADKHPERPPRVGTNGHRRAAALITMSQALDELYACANLPTIATPFPKLNEALGGGLIATQSVVMPGPTGAGKSSLLAQIGTFAAATHPVLLASYELPIRLFAARIGSQQLHDHEYGWLALMRGRLDREVLDSIMPRGISFLFRPAIDTLADQVKRLADAESEAPLVLLDYLQIMPAVASFDDPRVATAKTSELVRDLAEAEHAPILLAAAVSRVGSQLLGNSVRQQTPRDLVGLARETSSIEYDAAAVLALGVSDDFTDTGDQKAAMAVAKNRFGPQAMIAFSFDGISGLWAESGAIDDEPDIRADLREQIALSIRKAKGPLSKAAITKRDGHRMVRGRYETILREIDAMVADGSLRELGGKYHLQEAS